MQGFSVHFCVLVWRLITNIYCQTFFQEKDTVVLAELILCLSPLLYACPCMCERCGHDHGGHSLVCLSGSRGYVCFACLSMRAENLWCSTCVSNNTQPRRPGKGLRLVGGRVCNGGGRSGMEGKGTAVVWMSCGKEVSVKGMLLYVGIWCQYTRLSVMHYSPNSNTFNADFVWIGHLFRFSRSSH